MKINPFDKIKTSFHFALASNFSFLPRLQLLIKTNQKYAEKYFKYLKGDS